MKTASRGHKSKAVRRTVALMAVERDLNYGRYVGPRNEGLKFSERHVAHLTNTHRVLRQRLGMVS